MKKFIVAILALVYITTSTGATLQMHYCMGQLTDSGFGQNKSKTCGKCGMDKSEEKDNGCCKDEHKFIKSNTDQKTVDAGFQFLHLIAVAWPVFSVDIPTVNLSSVAKENPISHAPPRTCGVNVYILNRTFLI